MISLRVFISECVYQYSAFNHRSSKLQMCDQSNAWKFRFLWHTRTKYQSYHGLFAADIMVPAKNGPIDAPTEKEPWRSPEMVFALSMLPAHAFKASTWCPNGPRGCSQQTSWHGITHTKRTIQEPSPQGDDGKGDKHGVKGKVNSQQNA